MKTAMKPILGVLGIGSALFCLVVLALGLQQTLGLAPTVNSLATNIALLVFFSGITAGSGYLGYWAFGKKSLPEGVPADRDQQVRLILNLAQQSQGDVTLLQVAAETGLSIEQSRILLEDLVTQGLSQMLIDEDGVMLYAFPDLNPLVLKPKYRHEPEQLP